MVTWSGAPGSRVRSTDTQPSPEPSVDLVEQGRQLAVGHAGKHAEHSPVLGRHLELRLRLLADIAGEDAHVSREDVIRDVGRRRAAVQPSHKACPAAGLPRPGRSRPRAAQGLAGALAVDREEAGNRLIERLDPGHVGPWFTGAIRIKELTSCWVRPSPSTYDRATTRPIEWARIAQGCFSPASLRNACQSLRNWARNSRAAG